MSRVGKKPITIPKGVKVTVKDNIISVMSNSKKEITKKFSNFVMVEIKKDTVFVFPKKDDKESNMHLGTFRSIIQNMILGVSTGFQKKLCLIGVGYRAKLEGNHILHLAIGFSHPIKYNIPEGVDIEIPVQNEILLKSSDKELLGKVAADIRNYRKPSVYKGKGIRYESERVLTKESKKK